MSHCFNKFRICLIFIFACFTAVIITRERKNHEYPLDIFCSNFDLIFRSWRMVFDVSLFLDKYRNHKITLLKNKVWNSSIESSTHCKGSWLANDFKHRIFRPRILRFFTNFQYVCFYWFLYDNSFLQICRSSGQSLKLINGTFLRIRIFWSIHLLIRVQNSFKGANGILNRACFYLGILIMFGIMMVGNFQFVSIRVCHFIGAFLGGIINCWRFKKIF